MVIRPRSAIRNKFKKKRKFAEAKQCAGGRAQTSHFGPTIQLNVLLHEAFVTFEACGPLGPWVISNST